VAGKDTSDSSAKGGGGGAGGTGKWKMEDSAGITEVIKKLLSKEGSIIEEPRTNSFIITDIPSRFPAIEETIKRLDIPVPQVMLEVEMLDVSKNIVDKLGIKFPNSLVQLDMTTLARATSFPFGSSKGFDSQGWTMSREGATAGGWTVSAWPASHFGPAIFSIINTQLTLDFLRSQTDTKYLARPKILTLNNEPAEIRITTKEAVGEKKSITGTGVTGTTTTEAERYDTGVSLRITPQINSDTGEITMFIVPSVAEASLSGVKSSTGVQFYNPEVRTTRSVVRVKDGETVIVGGLIRNETNEVTTKLPILGDIPLLGMLFRHKDRTKGRERELLVFITPHIMKEQPTQFAKIEKTDIPSGREQPTNSDFTRQKLINGVLSDFEKNTNK
jgi:type IV pilus assembly protein PilQ